MILQSLVAYYEQLLAEKPEAISEPGWCSRQVAFEIELSESGELLNIIPAAEKRGWTMKVPEQCGSTSGISPNFLCHNSSYFLGVDTKGKPERTRRCFEAAKKMHLDLLGDVNSPAALAVCGFFENWDPDSALANPIVSRMGDRLFAGRNIIFSLKGRGVIEDSAVRMAWLNSRQGSDDGAALGRCLVSGGVAPIARTHASIRGVYGAQSMGVKLVSFNTSSLESYGHQGEQGLNAPVGEYAAFAYSTALNYLLAERNHHIRLGDTTIVYWADRCDDECSWAFTGLLGPQMADFAENVGGMTDSELDDLIGRIGKGLPLPDGIDSESGFHVLGLAPSAARLSVRFFYQGTFGDTFRNIAEHYRLCEIAYSGSGGRVNLTPHQLMAAISNPNAKKERGWSALGSGLLQAILSGRPYPPALYQQAILRVRATQDNKDRGTRKVTRGRASIIKAYLMRNYGKEEITVALDEKRRDVPYVLGRLFAVLEGIQEAASPNVNAGIKNRYFDSACATPSIAFPAIIKLSDRHLGVLERDRKGLAVFFNAQRCGLVDAIDKFPKRLTLEEQGDFILGYYHQRQSRWQQSDAVAGQED